jgi:hypothetical protein
MAPATLQAPVSNISEVECEVGKGMPNISSALDFPRMTIESNVTWSSAALVP